MIRGVARPLTLAALIAIAACSGEQAKQEHAEREAEAPYAAPSVPPEHVEIAVQSASDQTVASDVSREMQNAAAEPAAKVNNLSANSVNSAKAAVKEAAATGEDALKSAAASGDSDNNPFTSLVGDPLAGKRVFIQCSACHSIDPNKNVVGPTLHNIIGRTAGSVNGFAYSKPMKESGITWTEENLFAFLENPLTYVKGNRMAYPGVKDPQKRADLIAYLKSISDE